MTPPPIIRAAAIRPVIAHDGREWPPLGAVAATGDVRWCFGFGLGSVAVCGVDAEVVGTVVVCRVVGVVRRCFLGFGSAVFRFAGGGGGGGGGGGAGAVAIAVVVCAVEVTSVVVGAVVVVPVVIGGAVVVLVLVVVVPAASACVPAEKPAAPISAPRQP